MSHTGLILYHVLHVDPDVVQSFSCLVWLLSASCFDKFYIQDLAAVLLHVHIRRTFILLKFTSLVR